METLSNPPRLNITIQGIYETPRTITTGYADRNDPPAECKPSLNLECHGDSWRLVYGFFLFCVFNFMNDKHTNNPQTLPDR